MASNPFQVLTTPTADIKMTVAASVGGVTVVDYALTPYNDLALVAGPQRLVQDIVLWLTTPVGANPYDPSFGNPFFSQIGRPSGGVDFAAMLEQAEEEFLTQQQQAAAQGWLSLDEQVDHFGPPTVLDDGMGTLTLSFTVYVKSGGDLPIIVPFSLQLAA